LVMVLVGLFAGFLGLLIWVFFFGGIAVMGMGFMFDSRENAAAKARAARKRIYGNNRGY